MDEIAVKGLHRVEVRDNNGDQDEAILEIMYRTIRVLPPIGKQKRYPALTLTVIHAEERGTLKKRKKIDWRLITDLPVHSRKDAVENVMWRGLSRLTDIELGATVAANIVVIESRWRPRRVSSRRSGSRACEAQFPSRHPSADRTFA
jgi:hypothetical protein